MSVHYKFKSALEYDTVTFDGLHISVRDLKNAIIQQKRIGRNSDFDLQVTNAQTKEVYEDEGALIPKNTSLLIARVPLAVQHKQKNWEGYGHAEMVQMPRLDDGGPTSKAVDLANLDAPESEKIMAMMSQSTQDYDPSNYLKIRGANQVGQVPPNYRCYKCHQAGHWIKDCPLSQGTEQMDIKKSTGIPRSFMVEVEGPQVQGAMMTPYGSYAVPALDHQTYTQKAQPPQAPPPVAKTDIPEDLVCAICSDLLTDAVMIPCCGNSFCDECIRSSLLESEDHECPDCHERDISPCTLIPNRFLRNSVANFKSSTGYVKHQIYRPAMIGQGSVEALLAAKEEDRRRREEVEQQRRKAAEQQQQQQQQQAVKSEDASTAEDGGTEKTIISEADSTETPKTPVSESKETSTPSTATTTTPPASTDGGNKECQSQPADPPVEEVAAADGKTASTSPERAASSEKPSDGNERVGDAPPASQRYNEDEQRSGTPTVDEPGNVVAPAEMVNTPPVGLPADPNFRLYPPPALPPQPIQSMHGLPPLMAGVHMQPPAPQNYGHPIQSMYGQPPPLLPVGVPGPVPGNGAGMMHSNYRMPIHVGPPLHSGHSNYGGGNGNGGMYNGPPHRQPMYDQRPPMHPHHGASNGMMHPHNMHGFGGYPPRPRAGRPDYSPRMHHRLPTGSIIDDPLEAFNRMLREKDERERRAKARKGRSYSRSSSRSYSRSPPPRRRSRSPRRRSRSRSKSFSISRSRSRSFSPNHRGNSYHRDYSPRRRPSSSRYHRKSIQRSPSRNRFKDGDRFNSRDRERPLKLRERRTSNPRSRDRDYAGGRRPPPQVEIHHGRDFPRGPLHVNDQFHYYGDRGNNNSNNSGGVGGGGGGRGGSGDKWVPPVRHNEGNFFPPHHIDHHHHPPPVFHHHHQQQQQQPLLSGDGILPHATAGLLPLPRYPPNRDYCGPQPFKHCMPPHDNPSVSSQPQTTTTTPTVTSATPHYADVLPPGTDQPLPPGEDALPTPITCYPPPTIGEGMMSALPPSSMLESEPRPPCSPGRSRRSRSASIDRERSSQATRPPGEQHHHRDRGERGEPVGGESSSRSSKTHVRERARERRAVDKAWSTSSNSVSPQKRKTSRRDDDASKHRDRSEKEQPHHSDEEKSKKSKEKKKKRDRKDADKKRRKERKEKKEHKREERDRDGKRSDDKEKEKDRGRDKGHAEVAVRQLQPCAESAESKDTAGEERKFAKVEEDVPSPNTTLSEKQPEPTSATEATTEDGSSLPSDEVPMVGDEFDLDGGPQPDNVIDAVPHEEDGVSQSAAGGEEPVDSAAIDDADDDGSLKRRSISPVDINPSKVDTPVHESDVQVATTVAAVVAALPSTGANEDDEDVLDLYAGEIKSELLDKEMLAPLPELSRWEMDDETSQTNVSDSDAKADKARVTQDVLKRAENAIFAKAINAIRPPIEIKKISSDRIKLYAGGGDVVEKEKEKEPEAEQEESLDPMAAGELPPIAPEKDNELEKEREQRGAGNLEEVAVSKGDDQTASAVSPAKPVRLSVKERLGCKVDELDRIVHIDSKDRNRSRTLSPLARRSQELRDRRVTVDGERRRDERHRDRRERNYRERERDRERERERERDRERERRDGVRQRSKEREHQQRDHERERDRERERGSVRGSDKHSSGTSTKERFRHRLGDRDARPTEKRKRSKSRSRSANRSRSRDRKRDKDKDKDDKHRKKDKKHRRDKDTDRDKEKDRRRGGMKDDEGGKSEKVTNVKESAVAAPSAVASEATAPPAIATPASSLTVASVEPTQHARATEHDMRKVTLDEESFVPDYDLESEHEDDAPKKRVDAGTPTSKIPPPAAAAATATTTPTMKPLPVEAPKVKIDAASNKSRRDSSSSSDSDSTTDEERRRRRHRRHGKKKKRRDSSSSSSSSDSDSSDDEKERNSRKRKHKHKKSKKKRKGKHKS